MSSRYTKFPFFFGNETQEKCSRCNEKLFIYISPHSVMAPVFCDGKPKHYFGMYKLDEKMLKELFEED